MKNIIHFSSYDVGGAGSAALRFHKNLRKEGYASSMFVQFKQTDEESVVKVEGANRLRYRIQIKLDNKLTPYKQKYYFFDKNRPIVWNKDFIEKHISKPIDAIVLHWISGFIDLKVILELQQKYNCKVYWYLMDMAPMTGGCHYAWDCEGYKGSCFNCPAVRKLYKPLPMIILAKKKRILDVMDIELLSGASWLKKQLLASTLFKSKIVHNMMLGINEAIFKPLNNDDILIIKQKLGIISETKVIFFGSLDVTEKRKGFSYLLKALHILSELSAFENDNVVLLTAGRRANEETYQNISFEHIHIDHVNSDIELASFYQIADVFISPSIEDSGPMMINESILCGTPVVSFDMGVASDLVHTDKTGYLAKLESAEDLSIGIQNVLSQDEKKYKRMKESCRRLGLTLTSEKVQMKTFTDILNSQMKD